jgi:hypothetical protein
MWLIDHSKEVKTRERDKKKNWKRRNWYFDKLSEKKSIIKRESMWKLRS